ncbi:MAG TPA: hypothetical protein VF855_13290, partial [Acidimicrobiales bacterium]
TPAPVVVGADVAAALRQIAQDGLRRWPQTTLTVAWHGTVTPFDRKALEGFLQWVTSIPGVPAIGLGADNGDADIDLFVLPKEQWVPIVGDLPPDTSATTGLTRSRFTDEGVMRGADVVIDSTSDQATRNLTIGHELLHALGMGHHDCAGGLLYGGRDGSPSWTPEPFDTALVALTYERTIPVGSSADSVAARLTVTGNEPPCPVARYGRVRSPQGELLWCVRGVDPAPCYLPSGDAEPDESRPPASWLSNETLTVYDPSRYVTVTTPDGPALCEVPKPRRRRSPCQRGENLATITRVDFWSDGTTIYPRP